MPSAIGGGNRKNFESYLKRVYGVANTYSLKEYLSQRKLSDIEPGDVFVYAAGSTRYGVKQSMGHAMMVVDVAENLKGNRAFLLAEGNTPASDMHLMRNFKNRLRSPWFNADDITSKFCGMAYFDEDELRHW